MIIIYICIFFLGAAFASYINATIYRIEKGTKYPEILTKGSECEKCKKKLTWYELIPIFGYIIIGGRCPKCKDKVSIYYPISEAFLGISFLLLYFFQAPFYSWILLILLYILSYYDILYRAVPQLLVHILILISIPIFFLFNLNLSSVIITTSILFILWLLTLLLKKSFGLGDMLILLALGLVLSLKEYVVFFWISIFSALLYAILAGIIQRKNMKKVKIPMVPFFTISFLVSSIWGIEIFATIFSRILL